MDTLHSAIHVANRLLTMGADAKRPLTPMHLLKLVYLCHGWMLGLYHRPLVREPIEAWAYGPVIPELYRAVKSYRDRPVEGPIPQSSASSEFDEDQKRLISEVFGAYGKYSAMALSRLTHKPGSPWHVTYHMEGRNAVIPDQLIEDHYSSLANEQR